MFPVSDFNFMVAGIATFAATVGYTYARGKLNTTTRTGTSDNAETKDEIMSVPQEKPGVSQSPTAETGPSSAILSSPTRRESLKRKEPHDGFEEEETNLGYPDNLANIYPRKRCRTPSTDKAKGKKPARESTPSFLLEDSPNEDWTFIQSINSPSATVNEPPRTPSPGAETAAAPTPATEVTDSPLLITTPIPASDDDTSEDSTTDVKVKDTNREDTPVPAPAEERSESKSPETGNSEPMAANSKNTFGTTSTLTPALPFPKVLQKSVGSPFKTRGFADFAGSKSPFGTFTAPQTSSFKSSRPAWLTSDENKSESPADTESKEDDKSEHAIIQATSAAKPIVKRITGEEDEDVEMELKGVKLFTKRGDKPFAEGVVGHVKLLADRTTLEERLLFRREPLWKVSMNVRVKPPMRCLYDTTEDVLRVVTQEPKTEHPTGEKDENSPLEIVVYAMKPGRSCSKQDFKEFSETLIKNSRLKPSRSA